MNKKTVGFAIVIIVLALFALVAIQWYWIKNAILIKEAHFDQTISEVLSNVVYKIERMEIASYIHKKMGKYNFNESVNNPTDSLTDLFLDEYEKRNQSLQPKILLPPPLVQQHKTEKMTIIDSCGDEVVIEVPVQMIDSVQKKFQTPSKSKPCYDINKKPNKKDKIRRKSNIVSDIFEELFTVNAHLNVEDRMHENELDSVLKIELFAKGIRTEFIYGVFNTERNLMIFTNNPQYKDQLMQSSYIVNLFPNDLINRHDFLMLYFPKQKKFIYSQLIGVFSLSATLIIIIFSAFFIVMSIIFRQKRLSDMKNDFINNMTHELKTPISTIALACEALMDKDVNRSEVLLNNYLGIIAQENKRLGMMAEKVLQTAILEKGQLKLKFVEIDIHEIILEIIKSIRLQIIGKGGEITTDFQASNPKIFADPVHVTNVIYNLLDNANKYTPISPKIIVKTENVTNGIRISIKDNGIGISKADIKKIFQKLYRVPTGNLHDVKGFGLGLSYVKAIVERHGGAVIVESELKLGSTFIIFLPFNCNEKKSNYGKRNL